MPETNYPEHEKLKQISHLSQAVGEFHDWAEREYGAFLCVYVKGHQFPVALHTPIRQLLAEHFGIDPTALEIEKRAMLAALQEGSA